MKILKFKSHLKKQMENFVNLRRHSGTDYNSQIMLLEYFDNFLVKESFNLTYLNRDIIAHYFSENSHLKSRTLYNRFSIIRQFCRYLYQFNPICYIPESMKFSKSHSSSRIPYIYTKKQITCILAAAKELPPGKSLRPYTYYTLYGLLYTTGIRIGEALALNMDNFYQDTKLLHIREGKFHKARWVPLSISTCTMLKKYIEQRMKVKFTSYDSPIFINIHNRRLHRDSVYITFRTLLKGLLIHTCKGPGPRVHDLRHTFAVHRVLDWYREGKDVNSLLPVLATYMGHVNISSTQIYLQATAELLEQGNQRFFAYFHKNIKTGEGYYE